MIVGAACLSHTPYIDRARAQAEVERRFYEAVAEVADLVKASRPEVVLAFHPDHYNGVFYDLMPSFCVATAASSIGDFGTVAGDLNVRADLSTELVEHCLNNDFDVAIAHKLRVDHGLAQPLEMIAADLPDIAIIPVFINCAASPRPGFRRCRELGRLIGLWANALPHRVMLLGSGGLAHDPPLPELSAASEKTREMLIEGHVMTHAQRLSRQSRVYDTGKAFVEGSASLRPLNPDWDAMVLDALAAGDLTFADGWHDDNALTQIAGCGAHEIRTWIAALAASRMGVEAPVVRRFYHPIPEWITGTAIVSSFP